MPVELTSHRRRRGFRAAVLRADARRLLRLLGESSELSIAVVGDAEMQDLNRRYRGRDTPTDVLAFPADPPLPCPILGDVVISLDTAARQAAERRLSLATEVRTLLVHGVLHLLGYDHERSPAEARRMFARQRILLRRLARGGLAPPLPS